MVTSGQTRSIGRQIEFVVVPTCNRPQALERCLLTMMANMALYGQTPRVIIGDGSYIPKCKLQNEEIVNYVACKYGSKITLLCHQGKNSLLERLVSAGFDRDVVSFGAQGQPGMEISSIGANRNLLILATAGYRFASVDDDVEFEFVDGDQIQASLDGNTPTTGLPVQYRVFSDRNCLRQSLEFHQMDFLTAHSSALGFKAEDLSTKVFFCSSAPESELQCSSVAMDGQIRVTLSGLIGDCGWGTPSRYLFLNSASLRQLAMSDDEYFRTATSREMVQISTFTVASRNADNLMTTAFGADGTDFVPPFFPVGRGEDVTWGYLWRKIDPSVWFVHLPHAIFHCPVGRRQFRRGEIVRSAAATDLMSMLYGVIGLSPDASGGPIESSRALGGCLKSFSALSDKAFRSYLRECRKSVTRNRICTLEQNTTSRSQAYINDVGKYIERLREGDNHDLAGIPAELLYANSVQDAVHATRHVVSMFGKLLLAWPDMFMWALDNHRHLAETHLQS